MWRKTMLIIERANMWFDRLRSYQILLDGKKIGAIKNGEKISFDISEGNHQLYLKIDWCRSNSIDFENYGKDIHFKCRSNLKGLKMFLVPLYVTIFWNKYLLLEKID